MTADGDQQEIDDVKTEVNNNPGSSQSQRALSNWRRLAYGVGHVFNDLTASMWFSYMLIYLNEVEHFDQLLAGNLVLIGQVADAICTPFVGLESDRTEKGIWNLGRRKTWHLIGTISVLISFPFIFNPCISCANAPDYARFIYFTPFVVIFQFGWASVQINHLSFSSELTEHPHERVILQSIRNFFTVFANISVFGIFALLFYVGSSGQSTIGEKDQLSVADVPKFRNLALICLGIGMSFNAVFYFGTRGMGNPIKREIMQRHRQPRSVEEMESSLSVSLNADQIEWTHRASCGGSDNITSDESRMSWKSWFSQPQFYMIAVLYMCTRLYVNVSQVYFGFYLTKTVQLNKIYIAILPLFTYAASFTTSIVAPSVNKFIGRKLTYIVGVVAGLSACIWLYFIETRSHQVYGAAVNMGIAQSLLLITSLSMVSDLIGRNTESGAFVFGAMSFTDKLSNGVAILAIQKVNNGEFSDEQESSFYRLVQVVVPASALLLAFVLILVLLLQNIGQRRNVKVKQPVSADTNNERVPRKSSYGGMECCNPEKDITINSQSNGKSPPIITDIRDSLNKQ